MRFVQMTELERWNGEWREKKVLWLNPCTVSSVESYEDGVALVLSIFSDQGRQGGWIIRGNAAEFAQEIQDAIS